MRVLFLHNNFPAQFGAVAKHLSFEGADVVFGTQRENAAMAGIAVSRYAPHRGPSKGVHPYAVSFERGVLTGQAVARMCKTLQDRGFTPDVVVAHSGWGPGLYVKDVWPDTKLISYFEWWYRPVGVDTAFLDEESPGLDSRLRERTRNAVIAMDLSHSDVGVCPTYWQRDQFPALYHPMLMVQHDGVDMARLAPPQDRRLRLDALDLSDAPEIITYVARGMEPHRGFPQFMAALERVQKARPRAHAVIVGEDRVAYGVKRDDDLTYKDEALRDLNLDLRRTHFTGYLQRADYERVLFASSVHVYLTVPFVLSWSMIEAMGAGCLLVASDTEPVREAARDGETALLVDFHDVDAIAGRIIDALENAKAYGPLRKAARAHVAATYDGARLVPERAQLIRDVAEGRTPSGLGR